MNTHLQEHLSREKVLSVLRATLVFLAIALILSAVGLAFFAAA